MRIQKLDLYGFKSFPDRTQFEFGSGISGVVGPNGSGKSNVVDALRWVIGEQSARSLRGKEMSDVIFAGSAERSPVGFAEVTLTLGVGSGEPFPGDYARFEAIEVGRRLYRDGTSEYLINQVKCRRRDIVDLFMDTGVGANLYSFIAQGQVDRIVSQSAIERRALIDEAAGISKFKARREEALSRLTATAAQLDRAADASDEMGRRLRVLEKQVLKAARFRRARARIRQREIALGVVKYGALAEDRRALRDAARRLKDEVGASQRSEERLARDTASREEEVELARTRLTALREEAAELEAQRREQEGARTLYGDRHREQLAACKRAEERADRAARAFESAQRVAEQAAARMAAVSEEELAEAWSRASEARRVADEALDAARARLAQVQARQAARSERLEALEEERTRAIQRRDQLQAVPLSPGSTAGLVSSDVQKEARDRAQQGMEHARSQAKAAKTALLEKEEAERRRRAVADSEHNAWRKASRAVEARRSELRRWGSQTRSKCLAAAERDWHQARREADRRSERWMTASQAHIASQRQKLERAHQQRMEEARQHQNEEEARLAAEEERALDSVEVDRTGLEAARTQAQSCADALTEAERVLGEALEAKIRAEGRFEAARIEWEGLEARRQAELPEPWSGLPLFGAVTDANDPRRVARPDLLSLPMVRPEHLDGVEGRAVLASSATPWVLVADKDALLEHLDAVGPPVATRDGRICIDADGVVVLGEQPDRWSEVQALLAVAEPEAVAADAAWEEAQKRVVAAKQALEQAQEAIGPEEEAVAAAESAAKHTIREAASAAREALRAQLDAQAKQALKDREQSLAALQETAERTRAQQLQMKEEGLRKIQRADPGLVYLAAALGRGWGAMPKEPSAFSPRSFSAEREVVEELEATLAQQVEVWEQASAAWQTAVAAEQEAQAEAAKAAAEARARREEVARLDERVTAIEAQIRTMPPVDGLDEASEQMEATSTKRLACIEDERQAAEAVSTLRESLAADRVTQETSLNAARSAEEERVAAIEERTLAEAASADALSKGEEADRQSQVLAASRGELLEKVTAEKERLTKVSAECDRVRKALFDTREALVREEASLAETAARVSAAQIEIEELRKQLGDRYQVSLPGLLDRLMMRNELVLEPGDGVSETLEVLGKVLEPVDALTIRKTFADDVVAIRAMVVDVEDARKELASLGDVNLAAQEEWADLKTRHGEYETQRDDLEASIRSIRAAIAAMNRTCRERFRDAYDRVNESFQVSYPRLVGGGDARLALTDEEDLLQSGVDIFVRPPGKRLQNLTLLSGGEKAMTAIALLLALFQVRPSPFCVLDEVDAPLDEANGARFNDMIREMSSMSQFIVITHNRKTMECADTLYGVTMARPGVSTLVSVAFDREADG